VKIEPANDATRVRFAQGDPSIKQIDDFTYLITTKREMPKGMKRRFSLRDPGLFAGLTLMTLLKERGIQCSGTVSKSAVPDAAVEIYRIHSPDVAHIVRDTNQYSLNITAENILLYLGAKRYGSPGTVEKGIMALTGFLTENGLDPEGMVFADGSGLSHANRITPAFIVRFLQKVSEKPWFNSFYESLPRAGIDGTLRDMGLRNERIRAKTGRLNDAYCLAGYVNHNDGHRIAFAYMVNGSGAGVIEPVNASGMKVLQYLAGDAH
jgi:D-alanyl-D-alanine carboxypeptidase/D-alanyl-D-alanine-endopeptidase (penicillin-binding protein 4)